MEAPGAIAWAHSTSRVASEAHDELTVVGVAPEYAMVTVVEGSPY